MYKLKQKFHALCYLHDNTKGGEEFFDKLTKSAKNCNQSTE